MGAVDVNVFVTNLGKYNEGELVGKWLSLPFTDDELKECFNEIGLDNKNYEEYFITDFESSLDHVWSISEYDNLNTINEIVLDLEMLRDYQIDIVKAALECGFENNIKDAIKNIDNYNLDCNINSYEDYGLYILEECYSIPDTIKNYIDYKSFGEDYLNIAEFTSYGLITYI
ncbi:antirestriction protein ArdA [Clostridium botulinum]|uniref:Antirestriction protein ArdA n=1 Tax=Clostridium botulinum TaxID=1491 RepID=A0A846JUU2_CLOBO|nr:antirestriction protein ArdA [Clostridium botulinum]NFN34711.1 antirestriction protein ArdA [Clostridium botulinum]